MNNKVILISITATALLLPAVRAEETNKWSFEIAPYLWVANVEAETSLPQIGSGASPMVQEFDTSLSGGFMLAAQARYRSVGVLADFNWLRLDTESLNPGTLYSVVDLRSDYIYSTAALTYTLPLQGRFHAEVLAGASIWSIAMDFDLKSGVLPGFESSESETWVNPLVGVNLRYDLTRQWFLLTRGTVGGFIDSGSQWDLFGGVGYQFSDWCAATIGYRYLREEFEGDDFTFNAQAHGGLLGVVFRF
jgi:opacity protein-like surface antigen